MKANYLLPHSYKKMGWMLFIPSLLAGLITLFFQFEPSFLDIHTFALIDGSPFSKTVYFIWTRTNALDELLSICIIASSLLVAFSKERDEDEYITKVRLESLVWAVYVNYVILLVAVILLYNIAFFYALMINMFTILLCFIGRFHWKIHNMHRGYGYEKQR